MRLVGRATAALLNRFPGRGRYYEETDVFPALLAGDLESDELRQTPEQTLTMLKAVFSHFEPKDDEEA